MLQKLVSLAAMMCLANCGGSRAANAFEQRESASGAEISLTSDAFQDGQSIPSRYTCDGGDQAPALHWSDPPSGTKSFALVIDDPDAPGGMFRHWGVFDIPASARSIGGGQRAGAQVTNDFGKPGYGGPCPPKGNGPHHYHFKLFALNVERLDLSPKSNVADVEKAAAQHAVAESELVGTYERR